jgi:hypothetical protein
MGGGGGEGLERYREGGANGRSASSKNSSPISHN